MIWLTHNCKLRGQTLLGCFCCKLQPQQRKLSGIPWFPLCTQRIWFFFIPSSLPIPNQPFHQRLSTSLLNPIPSIPFGSSPPPSPPSWVAACPPLWTQKTQPSPLQARLFDPLWAPIRPPANPPVIPAMMTVSSLPHRAIQKQLIIMEEKRRKRFMSVRSSLFQGPPVLRITALAPTPGIKVTTPTLPSAPRMGVCFLLLFVKSSMCLMDSKGASLYAGDEDSAKGDTKPEENKAWMTSYSFVFLLCSVNS